MKNQAVPIGAQTPTMPVRRMAMVSDIFSMSAPTGSISFGDVFSQEMNKTALQQRPAQQPEAPRFEAPKAQETQPQHPVEQSSAAHKPAAHEAPRSDTTSQAEQAEQPAEQPAQAEQPKAEQAKQPDRSAQEAASQMQQQQAPRHEAARKEESASQQQALAVRAENSRKSAFVAAQLAALNMEARKADENMLRDVLNQAAAALEHKTAKKVKADGEQQTAKKVKTEAGKGEQMQTNPDVKRKAQTDKPQFAAALSEQSEKKETSAAQAHSMARASDSAASQEKLNLTAEQTAQAQAVAHKVAELSEAKKGSLKESDSKSSQLEISSVKSNSAAKMTNELAQQPAAQVEKANMAAKTAETFGQARLAEARELTPVMQVVNNIQTLIKDGETTMRVQLHPENLGKIELQLVHTNNGISVVLIPDQAVTGKMLQMQLDDLRKALVESGINLTDLNVGQQNQPQKQQNGSRRRGFGNAFFGSDEDNEVAQEIAQFRSSISALDYRV